MTLTTDYHARRLKLVRSDTLPEHQDFDFDGCDLAPKCLECPLPMCKFDSPPNTAKRGWRDENIVKAHAEGQSVRMIAERFLVSVRSVQRAVAQGGASPTAAALISRLGDPEALTRKPIGNQPPIVATIYREATYPKSCDRCAVDGVRRGAMKLELGPTGRTHDLRCLSCGFTIKGTRVIR